jgi:hypothetical protein
MKFNNLFQDNESEVPYASSMLLDQGGISLQYAGEDLGHVSFEDLDPFEIAFHAMPDDFEYHEEWDEETETLLPLTSAELAENMVYRTLSVLGELRGWKRS